VSDSTLQCSFDAANRASSGDVGVCSNWNSLGTPDNKRLNNQTYNSGGIKVKVKLSVTFGILPSIPGAVPNGSLKGMIGKP
jgi:hypothetical protein